MRLELRLKTNHSDGQQRRVGGGQRMGCRLGLGDALRFRFEGKGPRGVFICSLCGLKKKKILNGVVTLCFCDFFQILLTIIRD